MGDLSNVCAHSADCARRLVPIQKGRNDVFVIVLFCLIRNKNKMYCVLLFLFLLAHTQGAHHIRDRTDFTFTRLHDNQHLLTFRNLTFLFYKQEQLAGLIDPNLTYKIDDEEQANKQLNLVFFRAFEGPSHIVATPDLSVIQGTIRRKGETYEIGGGTFTPPPPAGNNPPVFTGPYPELLADCYPSLIHREHVGYAVDYGAFKQLGGSVAAVETYVASLLLNTNYVYQHQLNLFLTLRTLLVHTKPDETPWNYNETTCPTLATAFNAFLGWRSNTSEQPGREVAGFQFLTGCFQPPGEVGYSVIGGLCDVRYGVSIVSAFVGNWVSAAHEWGHLHGALHPFGTNLSLAGTFGGIMDYGDGRYQGLYQFLPSINGPQVCTALTNVFEGRCLSQCYTNLSTCFTRVHTSCGNGIVELGEACDEGSLNGQSSSCCNTSCQWKSNVQCLTGECCVNCRFRMTLHLCASNTGYCNAGVCTSTVCSDYGMSTCPIALNGCSMQCLENGNCSSLQGWYDTTTGLPLNMNVQDGAVCSKSPSYRVCRSGVCEPS